MKPSVRRPQGPDAGQRYRPTTRRRRLLIALLAVATAASVLLLMLDRRAELGGQLHRAGAPKACAPGQTEGCVGGRVEVIVAPSASGARGQVLPFAP